MHELLLLLYIISGILWDPITPPIKWFSDFFCHAYIAVCVWVDVIYLFIIILIMKRKWNAIIKLSMVISLLLLLVMTIIFKFSILLMVHVKFFQVGWVLAMTLMKIGDGRTGKLGHNSAKHLSVWTHASRSTNFKWTTPTYQFKHLLCWGLRPLCCLKI